MVISWPQKIKKGSVFHGIIDFSEVLPALADVAGIDPSYYTDVKCFINILYGDSVKTEKDPLEKEQKTNLEEHNPKKS
jgi:arylsulfatase A-like enzyme